ncbi:protein MAIN-LIKE 1-like [Asparagus officinalis]|uniref:protein MAIN-LIKE 1-like n=1 Tax=Asparagus officinalis TaxID=4686 RepID=UPI00098E2B78|nr:protein MAIN-LIKE 1-like [Asparagus officinalis]
MNNKNASSSFIYRLILPHLREDLDLRPKDIRLLVHKATNLDVSYHKCWNARRKAMIKIFGDWDKSYEILPHYLEALKRENPGTVYEVSSDPVDGGERRFTGVFWAFGPCIEGFRHCRPLLSIDGTHLYGKYKGVLLVATGVDADGGLFPLAFAVDERNSKSTPTTFPATHALCIYAHILITGLFIMDPGPENPDVLYLQASHCSDHIGSGEPVPEYTMIEHSHSHSAWVIEDERVLALIAQAGFRPCSTIRYIRLDWPLITALIERWRPETNTFHMHIGECTITLQDVAVILGLRIDGPVVTGTDDHSWPEVCARLLGQVPDLRSGAMKLSWLRQTFQGDIPEDASDETLQFHARAYILHMIGCVLFPDASKTLVHARWLPLLEDFGVCGALSWGSAVLAYLYRELSRVSLMQNKEFKGCCTLIQIWSWERIHIGRPTLLMHRDLEGQYPLAYRYNVRYAQYKSATRHRQFYRNELDGLQHEQFKWRPYTPPELDIHSLAPICRDSPDLWRARVPLICWEIVEMHVPDRVLRQFTLSQHIPDPVEQINRRRRPTSHRTDWAVVRADYIGRWVQRWDCIQDTRPTAVDYTTYMRWYWGITRRWITRDPQPLAGHMPRPPTDSYIPSGMNERDYVRVLDSIDADIDAHVTEIQDQVALGLLSRIKKSIAQVFHKTHVDEFAGREDRSRSFGRAYARRRRPRDDDAGTSHADGAGTSHADDAGTSHADGAGTSYADGADTSQLHTQPNTQIVEAHQ